MKKTDVIALGIAVMDILAAPADKTLFERDNTPIDDIIVAAGGDAANQAADLSGLGRSVSLCCRVGDDTLGQLFMEMLSSRGVDLSRVKISPDSVTSAAIALVSAEGQRNILCRRGNNFDFCIDDIDMNKIADATALSVGSLYGCPKLEESGLEDVLKHVQNRGVKTFADMASDKKGLKMAGLRPFLPYIDYFMPSEAESLHLTDGLKCEDAAEAFFDAGAKNIVIKLGARGAYAHCRDYSGYVPAFQITARDTTGAGDAFCAGFIHSLLSGAGTEAALSFACACGAYNSLSLGAANAALDVQTIKRFIAKTKRRAAVLKEDE